MFLFLSSDRWEVSLVNFMIPRAEASPDEGEDSALYGVSLVFQRHKDESVTAKNEPIQTEFVRDNGVTGSINEACDSVHSTPKRRGRGVDSLKWLLNPSARPESI